MSNKNEPMGAVSTNSTRKLKLLNWIFGILVIILAVSILDWLYFGLSGYRLSFVGHSQDIDNSITLPPPSTENTQIDTIDWKTYENKDYGFSFKYPGESQLNIEEQPRANSDIALIRISDDVPVSIIGFKKINCEEQKNIIFNNGDSINEKFDEHNNTGIINISLPNEECIKITKLIYLPRNEWLEKYNKQIDQILSTFRFTK